MNHDDFLAWVEFHMKATAANEQTLDALLTNEEIICGDAWRTSLKELKLATQSLIAHNRAPTFANEHLKAVGTEILFLRETLRRDKPKPDAVACDLCGGHGLIPVPHPRCISAGRLVTYMRDEVDYGYVATCFVICEACPAGRAEWEVEERRVSEASEAEKRKRPRMMTLSRYSQVVNADGVQLLREHDAYTARQARGKVSEEQRVREFAAAYQGLAKRAGLTVETPEEAIP